MEGMTDPYEVGTPKYSTASNIYDALCELTQTEEMCILSEMFPDVSYDNQSYYYTDKGNDLKEKFEELTDYCNKMWLMDLAVWQLDQSEIHGFVYESMINPDLAKRLGFKKLFIDKMLKGDKSEYGGVVEAYEAELYELDCFDNWEMIKAFNRVMQARGREMMVTPYPNFCHALCEKAMGLQLQKETHLIAECRALLTSYDDFMYGLRTNQHLYTSLENSYRAKAARLQESYDQKVRQLLAIAESQGVVLEIGHDAKMLVAAEQILEVASYD